MTTTQQPQPFAVGQYVETLVSLPHPAAFEGTIQAIGSENGRILVAAPNGVMRAYTPESLRVVA